MVHHKYLIFIYCRFHYSYIHNLHIKNEINTVFSFYYLSSFINKVIFDLYRIIGFVLIVCFEDCGNWIILFEVDIRLALSEKIFGILILIKSLLLAIVS
jgi:hypothetical protein